MRHGESESNTKGVINSHDENKYQLTQSGREQVNTSNINDKVDLIITSPFKRAIETAEIAAEQLGIDKSKIITDDKLREIDMGDWDGKTWDEFFENTKEGIAWGVFAKPYNGESRKDLKIRSQELLTKLESKYKDKTILLVTHGASCSALKVVGLGLTESQALQTYKEEVAGDFEKGAAFKLRYNKMPLDETGELNLHRPYIDDIVLVKDGKKYHRVEEVMDVWFDSGSMPWAQVHHPFTAEKNQKNSWWQKLFSNSSSLVPNDSYPADYISEAIDQTRGWFYVLQAIAAFMRLDQAPYKNVICLGHILDAEGLKMSKSKGNTVNPWEMIAKYGSDALRFWMYSVNQPGEPKNFDEQTVDEIVKKVFNLVRNSLTFYQMFADEEHADSFSDHPLDRWMLSRLTNATTVVTTSLEDYKLLEATREIRELIAELSQWYIRRSRDRFKSDDVADRAAALHTTKYTIKTIAQLLAPFAPYLAEELWQQLHSETDEQSVHLSSWPTLDLRNKQLETDMTQLQDFASSALALRAKQSINVRQPLRSVTLPVNSLPENELLLDILREEINVKEVKFSDSVTDPVLDFEIDNELKVEGEVRELIRSIQSTRKAMDLVPDDRVVLHIKTIPGEDLKQVLTDWQADLLSIAGVTQIIYTEKITDPRSIELFGESSEYQIVKH